MKTSYEVAEDFFSVLYHGKHHIPGKIRPFGQGWHVNHYGDLSTFDFDTLTRLVFLSHDYCIRSKIQQSGPRMVKICIWQRESREGAISNRHPTIETALSTWREKHTEKVKNDQK